MDVVIIPSTIGIATTACRGLPALPNLGSWEVSRSKMEHSLNGTKFAREGNEVLRERFCRRAGRHGSTAGETPATTMGVGRSSMNLRKRGYAPSSAEATEDRETRRRQKKSLKFEC